jgi:hypothetical protein
MRGEMTREIIPWSLAPVGMITNGALVSVEYEIRHVSSLGK